MDYFALAKFVCHGKGKMDDVFKPKPKFDETQGDNYPANTLDRLEEYRQEAVRHMREVE